MCHTNKRRRRSDHTFFAGELTLSYEPIVNCRRRRPQRARDSTADLHIIIVLMRIRQTVDDDVKIVTMNSADFTGGMS